MSHIGRPNFARVSAWLIVAVAAAALAALDRQTLPADASQAPSQSAPAVQSDEQQARVTCGGCHAFSPPDILPRDAWRNEFVRMMLIRENRLPPIGPPDTVYPTIQLPKDMEQVLPFYISRAPERLPLPEPWPATSESPLQFSRRSLTMPDMPGTPAVSNVRLVDFDGDERLDLLGTDMRQGLVFTGQPAKAGSALSIVASIPHPAHVTLTDVDRDGIKDLLVADLGEFFPADHRNGAVIWLRGFGKGNSAPSGSTAGRVSPTWRRPISTATARTTSPSPPSDGARSDRSRFSRTGRRRLAAVVPTHTIDPRAGRHSTIPADLNSDGKMDFVTLLAQQYETVLAYINKGNGDFSFERQVIYAAPHPNWGSSGIQLVDLDNDGDLDVLLTTAIRSTTGS